MTDDQRHRALWLIIASAGVWFSLGMWMASYNNFGVEVVKATGRDIGWQQSIRELPGLLAFTAIMWLVFFREQTLALMAILVQGLGCMATGYFTSLEGFFATTFIMSLGYHYYETMSQSLALQWLKKDVAPLWMGRVVAAGAIGQLTAFICVWIGFTFLGATYKIAYVVAGSVTALTALGLWLTFPRFPEHVEQSKKLVLRKHYWLYYLLNMMQGARRQIFTVFAGLMLVSIFRFRVQDIAILFFINCAVNIILAPKIGAMITRLGERWSMTGENVLLVIVFSGYALCALSGDPRLAWVAAFLFCVDGISTTLGIAIKTYFQKIGAPEDMASQAGVSFSINHLMAVVVPPLFGSLWLLNPAAVFMAGACASMVSIGIARLVPRHPRQGYETMLVKPLPQAAE